jgi:diguanylate cyclase (GGDEF)-like protein
MSAQVSTFAQMLLGALVVLAGALAFWVACLRAALADRMRTHGGRDALTGLPGRLLLVDRLSHAIARSSRQAGHVAVLFIDLDRFKTMNNTRGHDAGDAVLRQLASRLTECVGPGDSVARIGSDEFVLLLAESVGDSASVVARNVLDRVRAPVVLAGEAVYCTASVGIALHPGDGATADALLRNAGIAMYRAKDHGGNRFEFFTAEMHERAVQRMDVERSLRGALERGEFVVHYQPVLAVRTGKVEGFEALIRWNRPGYGLVAPADFVPVLEETGLIVDVGAWVLETACAQIHEWTLAGLPAPRIAVNLSARQFRGAGLEHAVQRAMARHGIAPALLELELTESLLMEDPEQAATTLKRLKALGVAISIDDFGTGYSGLAYLRRFAVDVLKVDRMFIADADSGEGQAMTRAIVELGHALGLRVVAEGVERPSQLAFLRELGCDEMQGFLFSPALTACEAGIWWERHQGTP